MPSAEPTPSAAARALMRCSCDTTRARATVAGLSLCKCWEFTKHLASLWR
jgi:hypothetical protein